MSLTVEAQGSSPLSYQWKRNGEVVAGQNGATLQLSRADETDAGDYTVTVSNAYGITSVPVGHLEVQKPNLAILALSKPVNGRMIVPLQGPVGQRARLEASVDFVNWVTVTDVTFKENWVDYVEAEFNKLPKRFYRLVAETP